MFGRGLIRTSADPQFYLADSLRSPIALVFGDELMLEDELFREFVDRTVLSLRVSFVKPFAVIRELVCDFLSFELGSSSAFSGEVQRNAIVIIIRDR